MALPSGYTQYEYIESSGSQYIDTGFRHNQGTRIVMDVQAVKITANAWAFEGRISTRSARHGVFFYESSGDRWNGDYVTQRHAFTGIGRYDRLNVDFNKNTLTLNGSAYTFQAQNFQSTVNLTLLAANTNGTIAGYLSARLYSCQIYDNGTLIRDYIPCSDPSGEVGLYDQVNGVFYGNAGTGTFAHGPVATPPAPQNLRQTGKTLESISLAWDAVEAADGYKLYRDGALIATQAATSYTDTGLLPSESHSYQVLAYNDQGDGTLSESVSMSTEQAYYVVTPVFTSAVFSPNPTTINMYVLLSVAVEDQMIILQPEVFQSNEIYSGEAS